MNYATKEDLENLKREIEKAFEKLNLAINITNSAINLNKKYCPHISQTCDNSGACKCNYCGEFIEDVKPKKEPWELYPDYKSCVKKGQTFYYYDNIEEIIETEEFGTEPEIYATSEKLAKRQLAELQLYAIAQKWGEGIEIEDYCYRVITNNGGRMMVDKLPITSYYFNSLSFHFKNEQQASKSIELHHQLWKDYFMID